MSSWVFFEWFWIFGLVLHPLLHAWQLSSDPSSVGAYFVEMRMLHSFWSDTSTADRITFGCDISVATPSTTTAEHTTDFDKPAKNSWKRCQHHLQPPTSRLSAAPRRRSGMQTGSKNGSVAWDWRTCILTASPSTPLRNLPCLTSYPAESMLQVLSPCGNNDISMMASDCTT